MSIDEESVLFLISGISSEIQVCRLQPCLHRSIHAISNSICTATHESMTLSPELDVASSLNNSVMTGIHTGEMSSSGCTLEKVALNSGSGPALSAVIREDSGLSIDEGTSFESGSSHERGRPVYINSTFTHLRQTPQLSIAGPTFESCTSGGSTGRTLYLDCTSPAVIATSNVWRSMFNQLSEDE